MPSRPPFFPQERDYSCVPACLPMVLKAQLDRDVSEDDIIYECNCKADGTTTNDLMTAAKALGFPSAVKGRPTLDEVRDWTSEGIYPIVWIRLSEGITHAVVVLEVQAAVVIVHNPAEQSGGSRIPRDQFERQWGETGRLAVVCRR